MASSVNKIDYNNHSKGPSIRGIRVLLAVIGIIVTIIIGVVVFFRLVPFAKKLAKLIQELDYTTGEIISIVSLIITLSGIVWGIIKFILSKLSQPKKSISIEINTDNGFTIVTCKIANQSTQRIIPKHIYLFTEWGIQPSESNPQACFPFYLKHEERNKDCRLCVACNKTKQLTEFPEGIIKEKKYKNKKEFERKAIRLNELCQDGRLFVDPGEEFAQDVVLKFNKSGVYRATVIWISKYSDCICATKLFIVPPEPNL